VAGIIAVGMSRENVEVVRRAMIAWQSGALGEMDRLVTADAEWRPSALSRASRELYVGPEGIRVWGSEMISRHTEVRNEIDEIRDLGDRVLVLGRVVERFEGRTRVDAQLAWLFELREGRIVSGEGFANPEDAYRSAGLGG
jgi:ketosteroid isomerase-like protein